MFIAALVKMLPAPKTVVADDNTGYYDQLIHCVFQPGTSQVKKSSIVAFASASTGAGSSSISLEIGLELARYEKERTAVIDARRLQTISKSDLEKWARLCAAAGTGFSWLKNEVEAPASGEPKSRKQATLWQSEETFRQDCLQLLRSYFNHILIDCHSLSVPTTLTLMAKLIDGVVIVASAGQTRRDEMQRVERVVEMAQGKVLGFVLNKRKYPIPKWLYGMI